LQWIIDSGPVSPGDEAGKAAVGRRKIVLNFHGYFLNARALCDRNCDVDLLAKSNV
jgi:hypothetical protein